MAATDGLALLVRDATLLNARYPEGRASLRAGALRWIGELCPTEVSPLYRVEMRYRPPMHPIVFVRQPVLIPNAAGELPHMYHDGSLCLYRTGQWVSGDLLVETIVPWTSEWLMHYEFWRATGEWLGERR